jgi:hypothetical protein
VSARAQQQAWLASHCTKRRATIDTGDAQLCYLRPFRYDFVHRRYALIDKTPPNFGGALPFGQCRSMCRLGRVLLRHLRLQRRDCRADLDRARLGCFGHFANHIDTDQAVVDAGTRHLRVVGEAKAPLEVAPGNAAVQVATAADEEVPRWLFRCEPHQAIGSLIPPDVCVGAGCP